MQKGLDTRLAWIIALHSRSVDLRLQYKMSSGAARSLGRLASNTCYFFLCDMQEKFRPSIRYFPEIITVAQRMVRPLRVLSWCLHTLVTTGTSSSCIRDSCHCNRTVS